MKMNGDGDGNGMGVREWMGQKAKWISDPLEIWTIKKREREKERKREKEEREEREKREWERTTKRRTDGKWVSKKSGGCAQTPLSPSFFFLWPFCLHMDTHHCLSIGNNSNHTRKEKRLFFEVVHSIGHPWSMAWPTHGPRVQDMVTNCHKKSKNGEWERERRQRKVELTHITVNAALRASCAHLLAKREREREMHKQTNQEKTLFGLAFLWST